MLIETCFTPQVYNLFHNPNAIVVVIDILRATSAITTAFYNGVHKMLPVETLEEAHNYKKNGIITAAERNGQMVEGFDLGNSPFGYMNAKLKGKTVAITTTNGTQAIVAAKSAHEIVIGSFLNIAVLSEYLSDKKRDIILLCAGWKNKFNLEDSVFAGALATELMKKFSFSTHCDSTIAAIELYKSAKYDLYDFLQNSSHQKRLAKLDLERDIKYCLTLNQCPVIPIIKHNEIVKAEI
ncbi:MAG: 2-phosphosulfolactate phosphatase [Bacteroidetes bacterium]|nr:2-phosphosulfolactate phosphatase [Bacteroidota bacterium]